MLVYSLPRPQGPAQRLAHNGCLTQICVKKGPLGRRPELLEGEGGLVPLVSWRPGTGPVCDQFLALTICSGDRSAGGMLWSEIRRQGPSTGRWKDGLQGAELLQGRKRGGLATVSTAQLAQAARQGEGGGGLWDVSPDRWTIL